MRRRQLAAPGRWTTSAQRAKRHANLSFRCPRARSLSPRARTVSCRRTELLDRRGAIFIAFLDQHDRDIVLDRVLAAAVTADEPGVFDEVEHAGGGAVAHVGGAAQYVEQFLRDHASSG